MSIMRKLKEAFHIFRLLALISIIVFIFGCKSLFFNNEELIYSNMWGADTSFNLNKNFYSITDVIGSIKNCNSEKYPSCIIFDSTVIMIPKLEIFNEIEDNYYKGRNESLDLNYTITKLEIKVLGKKIKGYLFNVTNPKEMLSGESILGELKGNYFYSINDGILFFYHYVEVDSNSQKWTMVSELNWSNTGCGFFSNKCNQQQ